jgi:leucyl-tRNA synthetase
MFMGPYDESIAWDTSGLIGCSRFLKRVYQWITDMQTQTLEKAVDTIKLDYDTHTLIHKITEDIENQKYNTCISSLMEYLNTYINKDIGIEYIKIYITLLAPFAPHITEELWEILGEKESVHKTIWPQYDESKLIQAEIDYQIHINGKMRDIITVDAQLDNDAIQQKALESVKVNQIIGDKNTIKKMIINQDKRIVIIIY